MQRTWKVKSYYTTSYWINKLFCDNKLSYYNTILYLLVILLKETKIGNKINIKILIGII